jgi:hypothetical protein
LEKRETNWPTAGYIPLSVILPPRPEVKPGSRQYGDDAEFAICRPPYGQNSSRTAMVSLGGERSPTGGQSRRNPDHAHISTFLTASKDDTQRTGE